MAQDTSFGKMQSLNCRGRLVELHGPQVMGILNCTPDSFFRGSRVTAVDTVAIAEKMAQQGAFALDIGAQSTRPGAEAVSAEEEWQRLQPVLAAVRKSLPGIVLSVDTFYSEVADRALSEGADMINDVSGGEWDPGIQDMVAGYGAPYVLMHSKGQPQTMQSNPTYEDVRSEVMLTLAGKLAALRKKGIADVIIDPGFGFGKSQDHNFTLLNHLDEFRSFGCLVMAGLSRKSMVCKTLGVTPADALNGTTALHAVALIKGVDILRVHDVKEAVEVVKIVEKAMRA